MKRTYICLAFLAILVVVMIGMPKSTNIQLVDMSISPQDEDVVTSFNDDKTFYASGIYLPDKIDPEVASTESILVRPKTDKVLRNGLIINAFRGKNFSYSKALFKKALARSLNLRTSREIRKNLYVVSGISVNPAKVKSAFTEQSYQLIEPNYKIELHDLPINDPKKDMLWGLGTPQDSYGINAEAAWEYEKDIKDEVIVGVIDTGVNYYHTDLKGVCWENPGEIANDGIDNDGNGYIDDVSGFNFDSMNNDPFDDNMTASHGSHVSGIIAAIRNNNRAIAGVTSKAKILPLKVFDANGKAYTSNIIEAIEYAIRIRKAGYNLRVLNMSFGGQKNIRRMSYFEEYKAIKDVGDAGITAVVSAGNSGTSMVLYPAGYNLDNIISVAAHQNKVDKEKDTILAGFSNYGLTTHISAPGVGIVSLRSDNNGAARTLSGTSMAAPHVSGVVAILAGLFPEAKPSDYRNWIINGGYKVSSLTDKVISGAILDAEGAIQEGKKATKKENKKITISGYVTHTDNSRVIGIPKVTVKLEIKRLDGSLLTRTVKTDSLGHYSFSFGSSYIGKEFTLTASDGENEFRSYSGKVAASNMFISELEYYYHEPVYVMIHVLDENLQVIKDKSHYMLIKSFDKNGKIARKQYLAITRRFKNLWEAATDLNHVSTLITPQGGYYILPEYSPTELNNPAENRELVFLPNGKEKFTGPRELPAPFIAHLGSDSIEVNMKPFSGVEIKYHKDSTAVYHVSVKNLTTKEYIVKESYSPKLVINNLEKGRYSVRYLVKIVDSTGKQVSGSGQWSPIEMAYVGYPIDTISPETHLYLDNSLTKIRYSQSDGPRYLELSYAPINFVFKNYTHVTDSITYSITSVLKNLSTEKEMSNDVYYDHNYNEILTTFQNIEPDAYELKYKINFIKNGEVVASTKYSDEYYFVLGYPKRTVHPKMRHDDLYLSAVGHNTGFRFISNGYDNAVYNGEIGYPIRKRYKISYDCTKRCKFITVGENDFYKNLQSRPKGHYMVQYSYDIMDGSKVLASTDWSNYVDYIIQ